MRLCLAEVNAGDARGDGVDEAPPPKRHRPSLTSADASSDPASASMALSDAHTRLVELASRARAALGDTPPFISGHAGEDEYRRTVLEWYDSVAGGGRRGSAASPRVPVIVPEIGVEKDCGGITTCEWSHTFFGCTAPAPLPSYLHLLVQ